MIRWILRLLHLVPLSTFRETQSELGDLRRHLGRTLRELESVEARLWDRYRNRLENDVHMSLSWFYTEHTRRVSMGTAAPNAAAENWPYYPKAQMLLESPRLQPERLEGPAGAVGKRRCCGQS